MMKLMYANKHAEQVHPLANHVQHQSMAMGLRKQMGFCLMCPPAGMCMVM
jgi:hypothetical protein